MRRGLLFGLFLFFITSSFAQNVLIFEKGSPKHRTRFFKGSTFTYISVHSSIVQTGIVTAIDSAGFYLNETRVPLTDVKGYVKSRRGVAIISTLLLAAGGGYILLDAANATFNNIDPIFDESVVLSGLAVSAAGVALLPFKRRVFPINERNKLFILDTSPE